MTSARFLPWVMWFFPLVFFGFQFILRLFPGLVMPEFLDKYQITATDFGLFAALYYIGYASMQIPLALLLDKFGPRLVIGLCAILCGIATWMLVLFQSWPIALLSRFLIGVGSVVGFLGASKVISLWFPKQRYARIVGLTFSFGLLGALYGGRPISMLIERLGWEQVLGLLGMSAIVIGILVFCFVRNKSTEEGDQNLPVFASLKKLLNHKSLFILAFANFLMVGVLEGFADVWGVPYLMAARGITKIEAASLISFIFVGMLFGGPLLAYLSEKFNAHHGVTMACGLLMTFLLSCLIFFNPFLSSTLVMLMMFSIGVLCCYQVIVFAIGAELVPAYLMSVTIALLNCINMLGGAFFHTTIGGLLDLFEKATVVDGVRIYSLSSFTIALSVIPLASLFGSFLVWWSKKKSISELDART